MNEEITNKRMNALVHNLVNHYSLDGIPAILDKIKAFGFRYATHAGITWSISDVTVPEQKDKLVKEGLAAVQKERENYENGLLTEEERKRMTIEIWGKVSSELRKYVVSTLDPQGPVHNMITSGARGSAVQLHQMAGMKGLITNPRGEIIEFPITSSLKEGLTPIEYFISTHGARKGLADTALNTARAGYLTRRLFDVAHDVVILEHDCGTKEGVTIRRSRLSAPAITNQISRNFKNIRASRFFTNKFLKIATVSTSGILYSLPGRRRKVFFSFKNSSIFFFRQDSFFFCLKLFMSFGGSVLSRHRLNN
jgi:DNA-directed RNA polymerase subunit beta'